MKLCEIQLEIDSRRITAAGVVNRRSGHDFGICFV